MRRIEEILHCSTYLSLSFLSDISTDRVRTLQLCSVYRVNRSWILHSVQRTGDWQHFSSLSFFGLCDTGYEAHINRTQLA